MTTVLNKDGELEDKVFRLKSTTSDLKKEKQKLKDDLKKAQWEASYFRKKANQAVVNSKHIPPSVRASQTRELNELDEMVNSLRDANDTFRKENLQLRNAVRTGKVQYSQQRKRSKSRPKSRRKSNVLSATTTTNKKSKNIKSTNLSQTAPSNPNHAPTETDISDIITHIRSQIGVANNGVTAAGAQKTSENGTTSDLWFSGHERQPSVMSTITSHTKNRPFAGNEEFALGEIRNELKDKKAQITMLTAQYEQLQGNFKADRIIQQRALEQCERYKTILRQSEEKNRELHEQICKLETSAHQVESLQLYIANLKSENESIQERVDKLTQNSLLGDQMESHRIAQLTAKHKQTIAQLQKDITQSQNKLKAMEEELSQNKKTLTEMLDENHALCQERDSLRKEVRRNNEKVENLLQRTQLWEETSGISMEDLEEALNLIHKSNRNDSKLDFLQETDIEKCKDPRILKEKIDELQIQNRDLILECTQNQNLLETQISINKKLEHNTRDAQRKLEVMEHKHTQMRDQLHRMSHSNAMSSILQSGDNTLFDKKDIDDICYSTTENLLLVKFMAAQLDTEFFGDDPLTMLIVDFFEFDSIHGSLCGGLNPHYNLACQYKLVIDEFVLHFLETDYLSIDIVQKTVDNLKIVSTQKISLSNLLITADSCIDGTIELLSHDKRSIGQIRFFAKFLRAIETPLDATEPKPVIPAVIPIIPAVIPTIPSPQPTPPNIPHSPDRTQVDFEAIVTPAPVDARSPPPMQMKSTEKIDVESEPPTEEESTDNQLSNERPAPIEIPTTVTLENTTEIEDNTQATRTVSTPAESEADTTTQELEDELNDIDALLEEELAKMDD